MKNRAALPNKHRPNGEYRKLNLGLDVPSQFFDDLQSIDSGLYLVWHPYQVMWESIIQNTYTGKAEFPRHRNQIKFGQVCFGTPVMTPEPVPENKWHIWRLSEHGWSHIMPLAYSSRDYLRQVARELYSQTKGIERVGVRNYNTDMRDKSKQIKDEDIKRQSEVLNDTHKANKGFWNAAAENFARGHVAPTNPMKETISSYKGQSNKTKRVRPLRDEDVLELPNG